MQRGNRVSGPDIKFHGTVLRCDDTRKFGVVSCDEDNHKTYMFFINRNAPRPSPGPGGE
jgi:hypothetical protein